MNILVIGSPLKNLIAAIKRSKYTGKLFTATFSPIAEVQNITFHSIKELIYKAKTLEIDIAITTDEFLIQDGIADEFENTGINLFAVNKKWFNLESSRIAQKMLLNHYTINNPQTIKTPIAFPIYLKTDSPEANFKIDSINELVETLENLAGKRFYMEEYLNGFDLNVLHIYDGKNIYTFPVNMELTEVQKERLDLYLTKLTFMLSDEKADFMGFFTSKLKWAKNDWYLLEYRMRADENSDFNTSKLDLTYILNSAIYGKLNEL